MAASLTRGISFRRQGSSGMSWTDTWSFNEEGVLVRTMKDEVHGQRFGGSALSRIHDSQDDGEEAGPSSSSSSSSAANCPAAPAVLGRSKSVGAEAASTSTNQRKSGIRVVKWLKKAFNKMKK